MAALVLTTAVAAAGIRWWQLSDELARRADASTVIEKEANRFERIRREPIRQVSLEVKTATLPTDGSVVELRITHDKLFSQPVRFFLASFREGRTWPDQLDIPEPSGDRSCASSPVSGWFRWYEHDRELTETIPLDGDMWAYRSIQFDGKEFDPPGAFSLPQSFELPSFSKLFDKNATIDLLLHRPGQSAPIPINETSIDLEVMARYQTPVAEEFALFRSRHTPEQETALSIDYLFSKPKIEREALLTLYEPAAPPKGPAVADPIHDRWEREQAPSSMAERATFMQLDVMRGVEHAYTSFGGGPLEALPYLQRAIERADAIPITDTSMSAIGANCWYVRATDELAGILKKDRPSKVTVLERGITRLEQILAQCPDCLDIRRWLSNLHLHLAQTHADQGRPSAAADSLVKAVEPMIVIDQRVRTEASASELVARIAAAESTAKRLPRSDAPTRERWKSALDAACNRLRTGSSSPCPQPAEGRGHDGSPR
ncbi:MAG TPA: hypothetical protein VFY98_08625 [Intrasporangium sp.]|nr:hypothetical protein [Intrasporangium sp.]